MPRLSTESQEQYHNRLMNTPEDVTDSWPDDEVQLRVALRLEARRRWEEVRWAEEARKAEEERRAEEAWKAEVERRAAMALQVEQTWRQGQERVEEGWRAKGAPNAEAAQGAEEAAARKRKRKAEKKRAAGVEMEKGKGKGKVAPEEPAESEPEEWAKRLKTGAEHPNKVRRSPSVPNGN